MVLEIHAKCILQNWCREFEYRTNEPGKTNNDGWRVEVRVGERETFSKITESVLGTC